MGAVFTSQPVHKLDKELLIELHSNTFNDIYDSIETIHHHYSKSQLLAQQEFEDIFSNLCTDVEPIFKKLAEIIKGQLLCDVFEALACFSLLSKESYNKKLTFIFKLFDFDQSDSIEEYELL